MTVKGSKPHGALQVLDCDYQSVLTCNFSMV